MTHEEICQHYFRKLTRCLLTGDSLFLVKLSERIFYLAIHRTKLSQKLLNLLEKTQIIIDTST